MSDAVAAPVAEAREYVEATAVAHADETGFREAPSPGEKPKNGWQHRRAERLLVAFVSRKTTRHRPRRLVRLSRCGSRVSGS